MQKHSLLTCGPKLNLIGEVVLFFVFSARHAEITNSARWTDVKSVAKDTLYIICEHSYDVPCVFKDINYSFFVVGNWRWKLIRVILLENARFSPIVEC